MRRRDFITLLGGAAAAWPLAARAQQAGVRVVGSLSGSVLNRAVDKSFLQGLRDTGFVDGQNVRIEYRTADGQSDRLPALAADLVRLRVDLIFVNGGNLAALAAKAATTTIPIVFMIGDDPVSLNLVASINHPGGNITGLTAFYGELTAKRLEMLHELVPATKVIAGLVDPTNPNSKAIATDLQTAAQRLQLRVPILYAANEPEIDSAFASMRQLGVGALLIGPNPLFNSRTDQLVALAARDAIPVSYVSRQYVEAGGLVSYGMTFESRQAGIYAGRILKGEKPGDLPVVQPTKLELTINLKTARALGLTVPPSLLARADEIIE
jgi:putative ABC transport system substrate-binding protein